MNTATFLLSFGNPSEEEDHVMWAATERTLCEMVSVSQLVLLHVPSMQNTVHEMSKSRTYLVQLQVVFPAAGRHSKVSCKDDSFTILMYAPNPCSMLFLFLNHQANQIFFGILPLLAKSRGEARQEIWKVRGRSTCNKVSRQHWSRGVAVT